MAYGMTVSAISKKVVSSIDYSNRRLLMVCLAALVVMSLVAVSNESFWIDEFATFHFARQPTLRAMWQEMLRFHWPEIQAPLYMAYIWCWFKAFGAGEWVLRMAGIPWFLAGAFLFIGSWREKEQRRFACMAVVVNPFVWYYLNEARLYSMQMGFALMTVAALIRLQSCACVEDRPPVLWLIVFCLSSLLLSALNALGMIWVSAAWLVLPSFVKPKTLRTWLHQYWPLGVATAAGFVACAGYYLWTQSQHIAPTAGKTDWRALGFVLYEQLGFNGWGPGRLALRNGGINTLKPWAPALAFYGVSLGCVLGAGVIELVRQHRGRCLMIVLVALAFPTAFLVAVGLRSQFRLLGRHFAPISAALILLISIGILGLWRSRSSWARVMCSIFLLLSALSCLNERFSPRHARDDYRSAARVANSCLQRAGQVWWNADQFGAQYYGVPITKTEPSAGQAWLVVRPVHGFEKEVAVPDVVIASTKRDIYDPTGALNDFLKRKGYAAIQNFPAFIVFKRRDTVSDGAVVNAARDLGAEAKQGRLRTMK